MEAVTGAVAALVTGQAVVLPTDTVYGLCVTAADPGPAKLLYRLKERPESQPVALLAVDVEALFRTLPELGGPAATVVRALLPGPYTLVVPNPAGRYWWLTGDHPEAIGIRVPRLRGDAREVVARAGAVAATSANKHGEPDPPRVEDVPAEIRFACAAVLDGGALPGMPSTVLDVTGPEPLVVREGAVAGSEAIVRARNALA